MNSKNLLNRILDIGIRMANEKDYKKLFDLIIDESMEIAHCDAGTLYTKEGDFLHFMVTKNNTLKQYQSGDIKLPPVPMGLDNVCSYVAIKRQVLNVADCDNDPKFSWSGPRNYEKISGYHTTSMVVVPLINTDDEVIGVLQLLNAMDENGNVIAFSKEIEHVITSLASQVAIVLSNMLLNEEIQELLDSFVESLVTAIDSRTPYNGNHSRNVARLCKEYMRYLKDNHIYSISENSIDQLYMAAMLHDVGKMIIPLQILDKSSRLSDELRIMEIRWSLMRERNELLYLKKEISDANYQHNLEMLSEGPKLVRAWNTASFLKDEDIALIDEYASFKISELEFLTQEEHICLSIRKGTITKEERKIIEDHAVYSTNILSKIHFGKKYNHVLEYASMHHEYLDGTGYPNHIEAKDISFEARVLTLMDIFESLSAIDRPYKKQIPIPKCYEILKSMAGEGKLDKELVMHFEGYLKAKKLL